MGSAFWITMIAAGIVLLAIVLLRQRCRRSDSRIRNRTGRGRVVLAALGLLMFATGLIGWAVLRDGQNDPVSASPALAPPVATLDPDERLRQKVIGVWTDNYQGKRTMTLSEDGTGTIVAELTGLTATLYADRLRFDIQWHVQDGCLIKQTTGGEPASKVALVLKVMGDRAEEPIQDVSDGLLILLDQNGTTTYNWTRVP